MLFDLEIKESPFSGEDEILEIMQALDSGKIKRFGAVVDHYAIGYTHNAMCVFQVSENKIDSVGEALAKLDAVSHCYRREPAPNWPYNLYAMVHARSDEEENEIFEKIKAIYQDFQILRTIKEFKKTSFEP